MERTTKPKVTLHHLMLLLLALVLALCDAGCGKRKDDDHHRQAVEEGRRKLSEMVKADQEAAEKRAQEEQEQAEAARRKAEERERDRAEARRQREEEAARRREESMRAAEAREEQEYEDTLQSLAELNLKPRVYLSRSLQRMGVSVEYRGQDVRVIQAYYEHKDWTGLIKHVTADAYKSDGDRPDIDSAKEALAELRIRRKFFVLIRFPGSLPPQHRVVVFTLGNELQAGKLVVPSRHCFSLDKHPDGIGYTYEWCPERLTNADVFVVLGDEDETFGELTRSYNRLLDSAREAEQGIVMKRALGELTEEEFIDEIAELNERVRSEFGELLKRF